MCAQTRDEELEAFTLDGLADGRLLSEIAADLGIKRTTLYGRMLQRPELADAYARAREAGLLARGEDLVLMARKDLPRLPGGGIDSAAVSQLKLEIETEKWTLSRLLARVFGDKLEAVLTGPNGGPVQIEKIQREIVDPKT